MCITFIKNPVHLLAMRIGFIRGLLWERYGDLWLSLVQGLELEPSFADPVAVKQHLQTEQSPGLTFQIAVAEARALNDVDVLVAPDLNPTHEGGQAVARGSGQDPWIASFPEALQTLGGLPPILGIPATLEGNLESLVLETLLSINHDPSKVRLVWERNKHKAQPPHYPEPRWTKLPGQQEVVAVLAQPWLLTAPLISKLNRPDMHVVSQAQLNPALLREEAKRLEKRLVATDAETLGAAHYFSRKGNIDKLLVIIDKSSGADAWLETQVKKLVTKPLEVVYLQDLVPEDEMVETLLKEDRR
jgi:hypothetical protein